MTVILTEDGRLRIAGRHLHSRGLGRPALRQPSHDDDGKREDVSGMARAMLRDVTG